jgi:hypothetical protein
MFCPRVEKSSIFDVCNPYLILLAIVVANNVGSWVTSPDFPYQLSIWNNKKRVPLSFTLNLM